MKITQKFTQICLLSAVLLRVLPSEAQLTVTQVAAGGGHSLLLGSDGSLWAMGANYFGQLGDGTLRNRDIPEQIVASGVIAIAAGGAHSLFLKSDGSLWGMGWNSNGQLGIGGAYDINVPELIIASNVTAIAAGSQHSLFLKSDGTLWGMGWNHYGQLGIGSPFDNFYSPVMAAASNVLAIAAEGNHSLFIRRHGNLSHPVTELWAMGKNSSGQLGDGTTNNVNLPELIESYTFPGLIGTAPVTAIAAGDAHSLFLKGDGSLWGMGSESSGELGGGTYGAPPDYGTNQPRQIVPSGVTAIAAGSIHSLFIRSDGSLWAMGDNYNGELGDGTGNTTNVPEQIVAGGVTGITAGADFSLFTKADGNLWAMGDDYYGELGDGTYTILDPQGDPTGVYSPELIMILPPPALGITTYSNQPIVFFPTATGTNYLLQMTTNLASPNWITVTDGVPFSGVQFTNAPGTAFFRLH